MGMQIKMGQGINLETRNVGQCTMLRSAVPQGSGTASVESAANRVEAVSIDSTVQAEA